MASSKKVFIYMLTAEEDSITDTELDMLSSALPTALSQRCEAANAKELRHDRILAYTALMYALYEAGHDPDAVGFSFSELGKPSIPDSDYKVSMSHAGGIGIAAISCDLDLGIDIELLNERAASTLQRVCKRFIPDFYPEPSALTDFIFDGEPSFVPDLEVKLYELIPKRLEGRLYLEKSTARCCTGLESSKAEKWTCAEALLKLDGRGFTALPQLSSIRDSAHLYSTAVKPHGKSSLLAVSLATK